MMAVRACHSWLQQIAAYRTYFIRQSKRCSWALWQFGTWVRSHRMKAELFVLLICLMVIVSIASETVVNLEDETDIFDEFILETLEVDDDHFSTTEKSTAPGTKSKNSLLSRAPSHSKSKSGTATIRSTRTDPQGEKILERHEYTWESSISRAASKLSKLTARSTFNQQPKVQGSTVNHSTSQISNQSQLRYRIARKFAKPVEFVLRHEKNPFSILRIKEEDVNTASLRRQYRQIVLDLHPDKNPHPDAQRAFEAVTAAFAFLSDDELRREFIKHNSRLKSKTNSWQGRLTTFKSTFKSILTPSFILQGICGVFQNLVDTVLHLSLLPSFYDRIDLIVEMALRQKLVVALALLSIPVLVMKSNFTG